MSKKSKKNKAFDEEEDLEVKDVVKSVKSTAKKNKKKNKKSGFDDSKFDLAIISDDDVEIEAIQKSKKKSSNKKNQKQVVVEETFTDDEVEEPEIEEIIPVARNNKKVEPDHSEPSVEVEEEKAEDPITTEPKEEVEEISEKFDEFTVQENETIQEEVADKKLTHKEKKKLKKQQEYEKQVELMTKKGGQGHSDLDSNFTMSQAQKTSGQKAQLEHAVDIKIENFTISAKGKSLIYTWYK